MTKEFYVFDTESEALAAEKHISKCGGLPDGSGNDKWADVWERTDGKFVFPRVPLEFLAGADPEDIQYFQQNFTYTIEDYEATWTEGE